jgi:hypothetical protein
LLLLSNYEGADARQTAITNARNTISTASFRDDLPTFTFDDYCNRHLSANNELLRRKVPIDGPSQVAAFLQGITKDSFQTIKSSIITSAETQCNLPLAVIAFKRQINFLFKKSQGPNKKPERIVGGTYKNKKNKGYASRGHGRRNDGTDDKDEDEDEDEDEDGNNKRDEQERDGLYIPQKVLDPLAPKFPAMLYMGRDAMRKQNQSGKKRHGRHDRSERSVKAARREINVEDSDKEEEKKDKQESNKSASSRFGQRSMNNCAH